MAKVKTLILHLIARAIRWNRKKVWKGLGFGEGKNLSLKGFSFPEFKVFQIFAIASVISDCLPQNPSSQAYRGKH